MSDFDEKMYDVDEFADDVQTTNGSNDGEGTEPDGQLDDLTSDLLALRGIKDVDKIKFEDESGAMVERPWSSLSKEEKLNILAGEREEMPDDSQQLDDDEIQLINTIRNSGMNVQQYMNNIQPVVTPTAYNQEDLSDDELYALNILQTVGSDNITDEELEKAIEDAKSNEDLYQRQIQGLRQQYQQLQQDQQARIAQEQQAKQQEQYDAYAKRIDSEIQNFTNFAGQDIELDNNEKQALSEFMLNIDPNTGLSPLGQVLQNPQNLTEAAFWLLNKDKIMAELSKQAQDAYKRGYEFGKKDTSTLVVKPKKTKKEKEQEEFFDDWEE